MPSFRFGRIPSSMSPSSMAVGNVHQRHTIDKNYATADTEGGSSFYNNNRFNPVYDKLEQGSVLEDWVPRDPAGINMMFRRMHVRDVVAGPAIDIYASMPWSEFDIGGIKDPALRRFYEEATSMFTPEVLTTIAKEFLVIGRFCASLIFNGQKGYFDEFNPHDPDFLEITPVPYRGFNPLIDLRVSPAMRQFMTSQDERVRRIRALMPQQFIEKFNQSAQKIPLDQFSTLFMARKISPYDSVGTSMLTRIVGLWALEKALMDATVTAARRRAGSLLHVTAGEEDWTPSDGELDNIGNLFTQADEDPVGAIVTTRTGVQAQEIKQGGQIWKISDEWAYLSEAKMRALGISDAILDGSACLAADTMIATAEHGVVRLGSIRNKDGGQWQDLRITVGSRYGAAETKKWFYNGVRPTLRVLSDAGNEVECTYNHPLLVLNGRTTEWRRADEIKVGDLLCVTTKPVLRTTALELDLSETEDSIHGGQRKHVKRPSRMTPDLAFLLGAIVAEGSVSKGSWQVRFSNTDDRFVAAYHQKMLDVFGLEGSIRQIMPSDQGRFYNGAEIRSTKTNHEVIICSKTLVEYLEQLGCYADGNKDGKTASHFKHVPWSILQADRDSQLAYLAAYVEGDGSVSGSRLTLHSVSQEMLHELQVLLNAHGIVVRRYDDRVETTVADRDVMWGMLSPYMVSKNFAPTSMDDNRRRGFGVPTAPWKELLASRKVAHNKHGIRFVTDDGSTVEIRGFRNLSNYEKYFSYDKHAKGGYDVFLEQLRMISRSACDDLTSLLECRYKFTKVESVDTAGEQDVFDLSMPEGSEPAFVANGIVNHNTYSNMETARSLMVEQILVFRQQFTQALFGWVAEQLARAHGFVNDPKRANNNGQIRVSPPKTVLRDREMQSAWQALGSPYANMALANDEMLRQRIRQGAPISMERALKIPREQLIVPTIQWRKEMKPTQDEAYIGLLEKMEEKGLPIPKRIWAAAGGYDLDAAIEMMEEDKVLTKKIAMLQQDAEQAGDGEERAPTGEPIGDGGGGLDKLDKLLGDPKDGGPAGDDGAKAPTKPGSAPDKEVAPEKPAGAPKSGPDPVKSPAPPSEVKPQRNPMAKFIGQLPFLTQEKFAGLRRTTAMTVAAHVDRALADGVTDPQTFQNILRSTVTKEGPRQIAAYLCARAGLDVGPIPESSVDRIARGLLDAALPPKVLAKELQTLAVLTSHEVNERREGLRYAQRAAARINATEVGRKAAIDLSALPSHSKNLLGGFQS